MSKNTVTNTEFWERAESRLDVVYTTRTNEWDKGYQWLAINCGVKDSTLKMSRDREALPKIELRRKIAEVLQCSVEYLETGDENPMVNINHPLAIQVAQLPHFSDLAKQIIKLTPDQTLSLIDVAKTMADAVNGDNTN